MLRPVGSDDVAFFRSIGVSCDVADEGRRRDWMRVYGPPANVVTWVVLPETTLHVSRIMAYCFDRGIAITPQGGNTGLVGGSVPLSDELILSLERMKAVERFDPYSGIVVCDAGITLGGLDQYVKAHGHTVPLDLGPRDVCQIGANIATNAGGLRFCRYGSLHGNVVGLEVVLADEDGTILDLGIKTALQKDNTGYDVKQLFIGSEGTLGIITRCAVKCPIDFQSVQLAWIRCPLFYDVLEVLLMAKSMLGEILSAFECLDHQSIGFARTVVDIDEQDNALWSDSKLLDGYFIIIETRGSNRKHDMEKLGDLLRQIRHPTVLCTEALQRDVWKIRTSVSAGLRKSGVTFKYDVSLPIESMEPMMTATRHRLLEQGAHGRTRTCGFGHLLDGNLHVNVSCEPAYEEETRAILEPWLYEEVARLHGSISAEHGIGCMKAAAFSSIKDGRVVKTMRALKSMFDRRGMLNPMKIFYEQPGS